MSEEREPPMSETRTTAESLNVTETFNQLLCELRCLDGGDGTWEGVALL